ncbi:MAG: radical SAM protein [Candidatus Omnitrophica bacterium]|nr:radical SAM protein [Candidatus Omnitrophota bacterium]
MVFKYIYGPIKSRRLGLSLGLSLSPGKTCNLNCIYCQWGRTSATVSGRREYADPDEIIAELKLWLRKNPKTAKELKFVTFSGLGEPTLNTQIGKLIRRVRSLTSRSIAVITNSTLLGNPRVRKALMGADLVVPSLDAVDEKIFRRIDRPNPAIKLNKMISGLISFGKEFRGKLWLEIMLVSGVNDGIGHINKLKSVIRAVNPDKIQLNSPVRKTAEKDVLCVPRAKLEKIKKILGNKAEII